MRRKATSICAVGLAFLLSSCIDLKTSDSEKKVNAALKKIAPYYDFNKDSQEQLALNQKETSLQSLISYAVQNHPRVRATYFEWKASIQDISLERSLPNPTLTFKADIQDVIMTAMPGFMLDLAGFGKLSKRAEAAAYESERHYYQFTKQVIETALQVRKAYYELWLAGKKLDIKKNLLGIADEARKIAQNKNKLGSIDISRLLQLQTEWDQLNIEVQNLESFRQVQAEKLARAVGVPPNVNLLSSLNEPIESTPANFSLRETLQDAFQYNPELSSLRSELNRAEVLVQLAAKEIIPDVAVGVEADVKANPIIWTPSASITLPLWQQKIKKGILKAKALQQSTKERLNAAKLEMAVTLAQSIFVFEQSTRELTLLQKTLLPRAGGLLYIAQTNYSMGRAPIEDLLENKRQVYNLQLSIIEAKVMRELAIQETSAIVGRLNEDVFAKKASSLEVPKTSQDSFQKHLQTEVNPLKISRLRGGAM